jgi:hypothetical protein
MVRIIVDRSPQAHESCNGHASQSALRGVQPPLLAARGARVSTRVATVAPHVSVSAAGHPHVFCRTTTLGMAVRLCHLVSPPYRGAMRERPACASGTSTQHISIDKASWENIETSVRSPPSERTERGGMPGIPKRGAGPRPSGRSRPDLTWASLRWNGAGTSIEAPCWRVEHRGGRRRSSTRRAGS